MKPEDDDKISKMLSVPALMAGYEEISKTKKFQEILAQIPESERPAIEAGIRKMCDDWTQNVLKSLDAIVNKR